MNLKIESDQLWFDINCPLLPNKTNTPRIFIDNFFPSDCNWTRTHNHLGLKRTCNHLAKLAKWSSCVVSTYLYGTLDCMFLSCTHAFQSESTLYSCPNVNELSGCGLSTERLRTKRIWVWVQLQSLKLQISRLLRARSSLTFRQLLSMNSLWNFFQSTSFRKNIFLKTTQKKYMCKIQCT